MFEGFEVDTDRQVAELRDLRPGDTFDIVMAGDGKVWRLVLDAKLEDSIIAHPKDGNPIRLFFGQMRAISLPG